ncbi:hypothetical protein [Dyella choica]|uniref:Uncharacterized protein n=1 Tax=Dyella choica TaxID=1927959 RepID=A0A3S0R5Q8_9GAMM|nr:hypothetical protein [Dyella choica]RUL78794.1 hypothetical protein EKH80_03000 [Dyella choica]
MAKRILFVPGLPRPVAVWLQSSARFRVGACNTPGEIRTWRKYRTLIADEPRQRAPKVIRDVIDERAFAPAFLRIDGPCA